MKIEKNKEIYIFLIFLLISAFLIRFHFLNIDTLRYDACFYINLGKNLAAGNGYYIDYIKEGEFKIGYPGLPHPENIYPPLFPMALAASFLILGVSIFSAKLVSVFFGSLTLIAIYFLARELFDEKIAVFSSLLSLAYLPLLIISTSALMDSLFIFLNTASIALFLHALRTDKIKYYVLSTFTCGLAFLTKEQAIVTFLAFVITHILLKKEFRVYKDKRFISFFLIFILVLLPWLFYNTYSLSEMYKQDGSSHSFNAFSLMQKKGEILFSPYVRMEFDGKSFYPKKAIIYSEDFGLENMKSYINFYDFILLKAHDFSLIITQILTSLLNPIIYLFSLMGIVICARRGGRFLLPIILIVMYLVVFTLITPDINRHLTTMVPLLIVFSVFAFRWLYGEMRKTGIRNMVNFLFILLIIAISFLVLSDTIRYSEETLTPLIETGNWIKENIPESAVISSYEPQIAHYSGHRWVNMPYTNYTTSMGLLKKYAVSYMVFHDFYWTRYHPQMDFLLDTMDVPQNLEIVSEREIKGYNIRIYKIKDYDNVTERVILGEIEPERIISEFY